MDMENIFSWATPYYSVDQVVKTYNFIKLPFIISVGCQIGNFADYTCLSEAFMRSSFYGIAKGAIAICASSINQTWNAPMAAQDEMNDLIVSNSYENIGGIFVNGMFQMIDEYSYNGIEMADTWILFGDPSLKLRKPTSQEGPIADESLVQPIASFTASAVKINPNDMVSFINTSTNDPSSYLWTFEGANITTSTEKNPQVLYTTVGSYQVSLTVTNEEGSSTETKTDYITVGNPEQNYCHSQGIYTHYMWIDLIALTNMFNFSAADGGYGDYTSLSADVQRGAMHTLYMSCEYGYQYYINFWNAWIDYNHNGIFENSEQITAGASYSDEILYSYFEVPTDATLGKTRMRVSMKYGAPAIPCEIFMFGEVEDYSINITDEPITGTNKEFIAQELGFENPKNIEIYPNPAYNNIQVHLNVPNMNVQYGIYDSSGRLVKSGNIQENNNSIDISEFRTGLYQLKIYDELEPHSIKFIKQ